LSPPARVALVLSCLATTALLAETAAYSRNTFSRHPDWVKRKQFVAKSLVGEEEGKLFSTRHALHRNRLNLHAWFGFNEFILNKRVAARSARWDLSLGTDGYLYFLFNMDRHGRSGIRLSRSRRLPAIHFRADAKGRFLERRLIPGAPLSAGWHRAEVRFGPASFGLWVDGLLLYEAAERQLPGSFVGFGGGPRDREAVVDDVRVVDASGDLVLSDGFRNDRHYPAVAALAAAFAFGAAGLALLSGRAIGMNPRRAAAAAVATQAWLAASCAGYLAFDHLHWSRLYHYEGSRQFVFRETLPLTRLERWRARAWGTLDFADPPPRRGPYRSPPPPVSGILERDPRPLEGGPFDLDVIGGRQPRRLAVGEDKTAELVETAAGSGAVMVVYLGTSQLWGAGAARLDDAFVDQAHRRVAEGLAGRELISINASLSGSDSTELLRRYRGLAAAKPALVVVDLSSNDARPEIFVENIRSLIELNRGLGIATLLVLEPRYHEGGPDPMEKNHAAMREASRRFGVPAVDLHAHLSKALLEDRGLLWWDMVHLTSYGQELAGRFVADAVSKALREKR
jgi:lysophospholipase L1-like esterase